MSQELRVMVAEALEDVLRGGWAKYLELEDGTQCRATWHQEGDLRWLQLTNQETGHAANFTVSVAVEPVAWSQRAEPEPDPVGPEDDGALRDELAAEALADEDATWATVVCGDEVLGEDGTWYEVVTAAEGIGPQRGRQVVTLLIAGEHRPYPFDPAGPVKVRRGDVGHATSILLGAFPDATVIES